MHYRRDLILISSSDSHWGIGRENQLLVRIPEDMKRFRGLTREHTIIVGRKTLDSFPGGTPLPDRVNVVLSGTPGFAREGAKVVANLQELFEYLQDIPGPIYVCGGALVYRQLLPYCHRALITFVDGAFEADAHLPNLDIEPEWSCISYGEWQQSHNGLMFRFAEYERMGNDA